MRPSPPRVHDHQAQHSVASCMDHIRVQGLHTTAGGSLLPLYVSSIEPKYGTAQGLQHVVSIVCITLAWHASASCCKPVAVPIFFPTYNHFEVVTVAYRVLSWCLPYCSRIDRYGVHFPDIRPPLLLASITTVDLIPAPQAVLGTLGAQNNTKRLF